MLDMHSANSGNMKSIPLMFSMFRNTTLEQDLNKFQLDFLLTFSHDKHGAAQNGQDVVNKPNPNCKTDNSTYLLNY